LRLAIRAKSSRREIMASDEIRDGFILRLGRLRPVAERERAAATHLIGGFRISMT
jgi:hypothetical protein